MRPDLYKKIEDDIREHGRTIMCIGGEEGSPPFVYTIGNHLKALPELLAIGITDGRLLNWLTQMMIERGRPFADEEIVDLGGEVPVKMVTANYTHARDDYTIQAGQYLGHEQYDVMQVVIPDKSGRFPGEPGCEVPFCNLPILKKRNH